MTETTTPDTGDKDEQLPYEQAREELVEIVRKLESGAPLEESMALWERGERLAALCQARLDRARERIEARTAADADAPED
ncbi:exodeoxyribonuclease VII small subunit [Microlunatus sp. Y2014]|uniref:exodeoxyribonuclease VII small subunit n=1 Tax=Microlunatus sp. Y2014 TaxID=3418488 RepID=UPI003DA7254C